MTINEIDKEYTVEWIKTNCFSTCVFDNSNIDEETQKSKYQHIQNLREKYLANCDGKIEGVEKCYDCLIERGYQALKNLESDK